MSRKIKGTISCPKCGHIYHRAIYDFDFIYCTERGCGQYFVKATGEPWPQNSDDIGAPTTGGVERGRSTPNTASTQLLSEFLEVYDSCGISRELAVFADKVREQLRVAERWNAINF